MKDPVDPRRFATTRWSLVAAAGLGEADRSRALAALGQLCRIYWYPLFAYVRNRGYSAEDAEDLTQAFFTRILEKDGLASASRLRGRFRSYLLGALKHFLANEWDRTQAMKRGGKVRFVDWESMRGESRYHGPIDRVPDSEHLFDREWALEATRRALQELRSEMVEAGKRPLFELLKGALPGGDELSRGEMAARLSMSEGAVKVAVHRLRKRYRELLRAVIAETVSSEEDLEDELRYLIEVLRRS